ncbi:MAG: hypothetical protein AB8B59_17240 [Maribacter sp.]
MELKEQSLHTKWESEALLSSIRNLFYTKKIKMVSGSLDPNSYSVIEAQFKVKGTTQLWQLNGVMDQNGGLSLREL